MDGQLAGCWFTLVRHASRVSQNQNLHICDPIASKSNMICIEFQHLLNLYRPQAMKEVKKCIPIAA
jgi:hypothetical protein